MSASRRPAPLARPAWMKSTVTAAFVRQEEPETAAKKVEPHLFDQTACLQNVFLSAESPNPPSA